MTVNTEKNAGAFRTMVLSMVIFGTIGICRRGISLPSDVLAFGRGVMGGVFLLLVLKLTGRKFDFRKIGRKDLLLLVFSGALIGFNWILLFEAYRYTTVAVATLCYYMQPVIVTLLSPIVLHEKLKGKQVLCVFISMIGMVLVSGVAGNGAGSGRGVLLGLGAAALYASVVLVNKYVTVESAFERTIIQLFSAAAVMIPYMAASGTLHSYALPAGEAVLFAIVGIVHTGIAYALYFGSMEKLPARTCALLSYVDPVSAVLLSAVLLREPMGVSGIVGTVLILGAAMLGETAWASS